MDVSGASPSSTTLDALGEAWSTWSTNDTIGSRLCVERLAAGSTAAHKKMPPYYTQNNDSST